MPENHLEGKSLHNVHKVAFLVNEFPALDMTGVIKLFQIPAIEMNVAIWRGQDMGMFTVDEKGKPTTHDLPKDWQFGESVDRLMEHTMYVFTRLARDEMDMEEHTFLNWFMGYPTQDVMICMRHLMNQKRLVSYEVKDRQPKEQSKKQKRKGAKLEYVDNVYPFYTLYENMEMRWGAKRFKNQEELR